MIEEDGIRAFMLAERQRLETAAPAPNFVALDHAVAELRRTRLGIAAGLAFGAAAAILFLGLALSLTLGAGGRAPLVLALAAFWILSDSSLFARQAPKAAREVPRKAQSGPRREAGLRLSGPSSRS